MNRIDEFLAKVEEDLARSGWVIGRVDPETREMAKEMLAQSHNSK